MLTPFNNKFTLDFMTIRLFFPIEELDDFREIYNSLDLLRSLIGEAFDLLRESKEAKAYAMLDEYFKKYKVIKFRNRNYIAQFTDQFRKTYLS